MKILAISDVPSKALWDYNTREKLEGIDLILSCGDLPKKYLEYLTNFTTVPILYVHGNHDGSYENAEPGGCTCVDDQVFVWNGLRIMGLGGCFRYKARPLRPASCWAAASWKKPLPPQQSWGPSAPSSTVS